jgi:hypothetical protein
MSDRPRIKADAHAQTIERICDDAVRDINTASVVLGRALAGVVAEYEALLPLVDQLVTFTTRLPLCCSEYAERDAIVRELEAALGRVKGEGSVMNAKWFAVQNLGRTAMVLGRSERGERGIVTGYWRRDFLCDVLLDAPGGYSDTDEADVVLRPFVHGLWRAPLEKLRLAEEPAKAPAKAPKPSAFWLVWSPTGEKPPHYRHTSAESARAEAARLARAHRGERFFVVEAKCYCECADVVTVDLVDSENEIPF